MGWRWVSNKYYKFGDGHPLVFFREGIKVVGSPFQYEFKLCFEPIEDEL